MGVIILLFIICMAFYRHLYKKWGFKGKLIFKSILLCFTVSGTLLMALLLIWSVRETFESEKDKSLSVRLQTTEYDANEGRYTDMAFWLDADGDYEPEFAYLWERLMMYASYNRYVVFAAAEEREELSEAFAGKAEYYKTEFIRLCQEPEYPQNEEFGAYYLEEKIRQQMKTMTCRQRTGK